MAVKKPVSRQSFSNVIFTIFSFLLLFYLVQIQTQNITQRLEEEKRIAGIEAQKENQVLPVRLKVPSINVDATVEYMGVTSAGVMEVPQGAINVGWFKLGPRPGEKGSAVIVGHFDGKNGEPGVFTNIYKLKKGDMVYVEDSKGASLPFVVQESRIYNPGYADNVFSRNDGAYLNLVTCDGVWDGVEKSYTKRLVVFAAIVK